MVEQCDTSNPRIMQKELVDPASCACQECPVGWSSDGGPPAVASCYPDVMPRYFSMQLEMATPLEYSDYDFTSLNLSSAVMEAFAQEMVSTLPTKVQSGRALSSSSSMAPVSIYGAVQKSNILQLSTTSIFVATFSFNGTKENLRSLVDLAANCADLSCPNGGSDACVQKTKWRLCDIFASTSPSSKLYGLDISKIESSAGMSPPLVSDVP